MKKILIFILGITTVFSCSNNDDGFELTSKEQPLTNNLLLNNIDISQFVNPIFLEGNFQYWMTKNNEFVIYTKTDKSNHLFILQGDSNLNKNLANHKIDNILYLDNSLIVSSDNDAFYFGVNKKEEETLLKQLSSNNKIFNSKNYGYGLIHNWNSKNVKIDIESLKNANSIIDELIKLDTNSRASGGCDHGGEGATSCSISNSSGSGCSVSCSSGYYACCTIGVITDSCVCIKIKPNN